MDLTHAEQIKIAYDAAMAADRELSRALEAQFGKAAGDKRYQHSTYRDYPHLAALADQKCRTYDAWETLSRQGSK